jgi:ferredoxin
MAPDTTERRFGTLTVRIDRTLCVGFGDCMDAAPGVFIFDDDGIAVFAADVAPPDADTLRAACAACPVDALTLLDADGSVLVP